MNRRKLDPQVSVSGQITTKDLIGLVSDGIEVIICNRPDGEAADQTNFSDIKQAAQALGLTAYNITFVSGQLDEALVRQFSGVLANGKKVHAYCRTGNRSEQIWKATQQLTGSGLIPAMDENTNIDGLEHEATQREKPCFDVVIIGAGSGGVAVSSSLYKRNKQLRIVVIDASSKHYYQPGWTMVGGGVFSPESTERDTASLFGRQISHIKQNVAKVLPSEGKVVLDDLSEVYYQQLIVSPGLELSWDAIEGAEDTLGKNGVTSNYRYDLAPYTWELVKNLKQGKAIFTQPPMPIKCAGAPQKALYLSADHWCKNGVLNNIDIEFCNAGGVLFGIETYVPALMEYIKKYHVALNFSHNLVKVDGENKKAWFDVIDENGEQKRVCKDFDLLHICPSQRAPEFIKASGLADNAGWLNVDPHTLQHVVYKNIWGLGDAMNTTNAKTMAAIRKQVPIVATNICDSLTGKPVLAKYDGYGSCPLIVERGKIVLAEFCYGGRITPTFPSWLNNGAQPTRLAWWLKVHALPQIYWQGMLKGREWLTKSVVEF
ncbi:MAG: bifunctional protein tyrosine phosphatase family protein/NAD(P)/FAD-dependent oxidoreductase [Opitutaceae bacterium]|nr:bifunctional protein tyrosine phosphatase family protein/NAD(P)/FAD-dependent oxidoreductase [Opitutaceae bacterium]